MSSCKAYGAFFHEIHTQCDTLNLKQKNENLASRSNLKLIPFLLPFVSLRSQYFTKFISNPSSPYKTPRQLVQPKPNCIVFVEFHFDSIGKSGFCR